VLAHIGNIPVEEWVPFLIPLLGVYLYIRRANRRRRREIERLPKPDRGIDRRTSELVVGRWKATGHGILAQELLPILYPPGPDGATARELAARIGTRVPDLMRHVEDLAELGYADLERGAADDDLRVWLTADGFDVLNITEDAVLAALEQPTAEATGRGGGPQA
jgi:hypothetical protein